MNSRPLSKALNEGLDEPPVECRREIQAFDRDGGGDALVPPAIDDAKGPFACNGVDSKLTVNDVSDEVERIVEGCALGHLRT